MSPCLVQASHAVVHAFRGDGARTYAALLQARARNVSETVCGSGKHCLHSGTVAFRRTWF